MTRSLSDLHDQIVRGDHEAIREFVDPFLPSLIDAATRDCGADNNPDWQLVARGPTPPRSGQNKDLDRVRKAFASLMCRAALGQVPASAKTVAQPPGQVADTGKIAGFGLPVDQVHHFCKKWLQLLGEKHCRQAAIAALAGCSTSHISSELDCTIEDVQQLLEQIWTTWEKELAGRLDTTIVVDDVTVDEATNMMGTSRPENATAETLQEELRLRVKLLSGMKPFCDLPLTVAAAIAEKLIVREYDKGQVLLRQGESSEQLIVLVDGKVDVQVVDEMQTSHTIGRGVRHAVLGEISLLTGQPHSATVVAKSSVRALVLSGVEFRQIAARVPTLGVGFADVIGERLGRKDVDALFGKEVHGYRINRRLGRGGMAIVYEGQDLRSGRQVALKMMRHPLAYDQRSVERFMHEARVVSSLGHANILRTYECFADYNTFFIVMQLCRGPTLRTISERSGPLLEKDARPILGQLAAGLAYAHQQGVIHRDLKPANVLFDGEGTLRLSDFGLARSKLSSGLTQQSALIGTPFYMAPEQLVGESVDLHADIFAFGCLTFELLAGRRLFRETSLLRLIQQQPVLAARAIEDLESERAALNDPLSDDVLEILSSSLALCPNNRHTNLAEIAQWSAPINSELLCA